MVQLSSDHAFHYEILRGINCASYGGADIGEVFLTADEIEPGKFESFYQAFNKRAEHILGQAQRMKNPVSVRDALFRAATYFRLADFYIHAKWDDPRILELWEKQMKCFDHAMALSPFPGERKLIPTPHGFDIPIIFFRARHTAGEKRPTIVMASGFDGSMEEMYHVHGIAALERGFNVVCYEGPGQQFIRRSQGVPFILEWEKAVTPLLDYLETVPCIDATKIALIGYSMGGFLAPRAACFEHRLAALIVMDGIYDFGSTVVVTNAKKYVQANLTSVDDAAIQEFINDSSLPTSLRWSMAHGMWSFKVKTPAELIKRFEEFTLDGIAHQIQCPVLVCDPEDDHFFKGSPKLLVDALGDKATHLVFTKDDAAGEHCHIGASRYCNQVIYDWFEEKILEKYRGLNNRLPFHLT